MFYFKKDWIAANRALKNQWGWVQNTRSQHEHLQAAYNANLGIRTNANEALLPQDAYRELDTITKRVFTNDEGQGYLQSLMQIAKPLNLGKTVYLYRQASDKSGIVDRSLSGKVPDSLSKTVYTFEGDPVPVFTSGYGREWREQLGYQSADFDAMFDDQENATRDIKEDMADYLLNGDSKIVARGYTGYGILNHPNTQALDLGASGSNIDLTSATNDEIIAYFTGDFAESLDDNYCAKVDEMWVSPQIRRRFAEPYSASAGFKEGTLEEYLLRYGRIGKIDTTFELGKDSDGNYNADGEGNEFFCYVKNQQALCPLVGQAVSTLAIPRLMPMDNFNNLIWGAMGMQVRADANGRSQVFYASEVSQELQMKRKITKLWRGCKKLKVGQVIEVEKLSPLMAKCSEAVEETETSDTAETETKTTAKSATKAASK